MTDAIVSAVADKRVRSLAGETPLRRLLSVLSLAHSLISVDTGPAHAAAAIGCPLVVLFGATDPRVNGPIATSAPVSIISGPPDAKMLDGEAGWAARVHDKVNLVFPRQLFNIFLFASIDKFNGKSFFIPKFILHFFCTFQVEIGKHHQFHPLTRFGNCGDGFPYSPHSHE
jgi:hypothetical protein